MSCNILLTVIKFYFIWFTYFFLILIGFKHPKHHIIPPLNTYFPFPRNTNILLYKHGTINNIQDTSKQ